MLIPVPLGGAPNAALEQVETESGIETRFHAVCSSRPVFMMSRMHTWCAAVGAQQCVQRCKATCIIIINQKLIRHNVYISARVHHSNKIL